MKRVLVVDDDADVTDTVGDALTRAGYAVACARDGAEALGRLDADGPWDLVVMDLVMPVMDGWELLAAMAQREALAGVPVVVCTAASARAMPDGARVLPKPMAERELLRAVARALGGERRDSSPR